MTCSREMRIINKDTFRFKMNICAVEQLPFDAAATHYDVVIVASGYESRARFVAVNLRERNVPIDKRIVLSFAEHTQECARPENDAVFEQLGYESVVCRGGSVDEVLNAVSIALAKLSDSQEPRILVDISSMTRAWYGAIVRCLISLKLEYRVRVHFTYTASEFMPPPNEYPPNRIVAPVAGFTGNTLPDKPTALVLGLGYDKDRAIGLKDHLDPQLTVLFYADPASDIRYVTQVLEVNRSLIQEVGEDRVFTYPIGDCAVTFRFLDSICKGLTHDWRVVLCSLGPKVFGLSCFLVASFTRDISIWRVSADSHELPFDHKPFGSPILLETEWQ
jgi:hypothetical protein